MQRDAPVPAQDWVLRALPLLLREGTSQHPTALCCHGWFSTGSPHSGDVSMKRNLGPQTHSFFVQGVFKIHRYLSPAIVWTQYYRTVSVVQSQALLVNLIYFLSLTGDQGKKKIKSHPNLKRDQQKAGLPKSPLFCHVKICSVRLPATRTREDGFWAAETIPAHGDGSTSRDLGCRSGSGCNGDGDGFGMAMGMWLGRDSGILQSA